MQYSDSHGVYSTPTPYGTMSSLIDMLTSTRSSLAIMLFNLTTERHNPSETSTLVSIWEGAVGNHPRKSEYAASGQLHIPDTQKQLFSCTLIEPGNLKTTKGTWLGNLQHIQTL